MENASKALIIAGAILLAILIIGIGMVVYRRAASTLNGIDMSEQQIQAYNAEFEAYEGNNVTGSDVRALINKINAHNRQNSAEPSLQIQVSSGGSVTTDAYTGAAGSGLNTSASSFAVAKTYKVTLGYEPKSHYIVGIDIKEN